MYTYIPTPLSFRLSAWPYGGDHYVKTYYSDRYRFDIKAVLDYIEEQLNKTAIAFVFKTTFTLINVYSSYHQKSVGLSVEPDASLMRGPLVFTFARTRKDNAHMPASTFWQTSKTALWGLDHYRPADFISISIPINLAMRARLNTVMVHDLIALHDIVGGWSKAVVMRRRPIDTKNADIIKSKVLRWPIPKTMWRSAIVDWKYCLDFWVRMPDLLNVEWTPTFIEYYCRFIAPNLPQRQRSPLYARYFEEVKDQITHFILRYMQGTILPEEQNLQRFLPIMDATVDVETLATNIAKGLVE